MIEDTIARIEEHLRTTDKLTSGERLELQELLAQLRLEARSLPKSTPHSVSSTSEGTAHSALDQLHASLSGFESTHPQLVNTVNRISTILANMGI